MRLPGPRALRRAALWPVLLPMACAGIITGSAAHAAAPGTGAYYGGRTSQHPGRYGTQRLPSNHVAFTYVDGEVRDFSIPWEEPCYSGTAAPLLDRVELPGALAVSDGSFAASGRYSFRPGRHQTADVNLALQGRIRGVRASGSLTISADLIEGTSGRAVCGVTTPIRWSAVAGVNRVSLAFPALEHPQRYFPPTPFVYTQTNEGTGRSRIAFTFGETYPEYPVTSPPAGASDSNPSMGEAPDLMAFQRTAAGISQIYTGGGMGGGDRRLTDFSSGASDPAVSPDSGEIVFSVGTGADCSLWVMSYDGSDQRQLTDHGATPGCDEAPAWSPQGTSVAFRRTQTDAAGKPTGVTYLIVPASGGTPSPLSFPAPVEAFSWAPGKELVFLSPGGPATLPSLQTVNPDGSGERTILRASGLTGRPAWSLGGGSIAFTRRGRDGRTYIGFAPTTGGPTIAITDMPGTSDSDPTPGNFPATSPSEGGSSLHVIASGGHRHRRPRRRRYRRYRP